MTTLDRETALHLAAEMAAAGVPEVHAYAVRATGTRLRSFDLGPVRVTVDHRDSDALLADAAAVLATLPSLAVDLAAEVADLRARLASLTASAPPAPPPPPPLRTRRWKAGQHSRRGGATQDIRAGADCPLCNVWCEPLGGWGWRCPRCGLKGEGCGSVYGFKACELPQGHDGDCESPSGTSWPNPHQKDVTP